MCFGAQPRGRIVYYAEGNERQARRNDRRRCTQTPYPAHSALEHKSSKTLGFGLNVQLVFHSALNIVQLFTAAAVVAVVQHCYKQNPSKFGVVRRNFATRSTVYILYNPPQWAYLYTLRERAVSATPRVRNV